MSGTRAPSDQNERSSNFAVERSVYTGTATSATTSATQNATLSARGGPRSGRTIVTRNAKSPIAAMSERNESQRAVTSIGVAAVSDSDGILNCGAGPWFGPTANV